MKQTVAQLLLMLTVLSLASCSMEKRVYTKGYHISWNTIKTDAMQGCSKGASQVLPKDLSSNLSQNLETGVSQDLPSNLSQNLETDISQDLSSNLSQNLETEISQDLLKDLAKKFSKNLEIETPFDTITPNSKEEDYFGDKVYKPSKEKIRPYFQRPIKKPKTIEDLKLAIKFDFRLTLASLLLLTLTGGFIYLGFLIVNKITIFRVLLFIIAFALLVALLFFLIRAFLRTLKLATLKIFRKSDETEINNHKHNGIVESEHQYFRRFFKALGRFFKALGKFLKFIVKPKSFKFQVLAYFTIFVIGIIILAFIN